MNRSWKNCVFFFSNAISAIGPRANKPQKRSKGVSMIVASPVMTAELERPAARGLSGANVRLAKGRGGRRPAGLFLGTFGRAPILPPPSRAGYSLHRFLLDWRSHHRRLRGVLLHARSCPPVQSRAGYLFRFATRSCGSRPAPAPPVDLAGLCNLRMSDPGRVELLRPLRGKCGGFWPIQSLIPNGCLTYSCGRAAFPR